MVKGLFAAVLLVFASGAPAQEPGNHFSLGQRFSWEASRVAGPTSLLSAAAGAGIGQWRDEPGEWGQEGSGYARRFGYLMAGNAANRAISFAAGAALREDPRYFRSGRAGIWRRTWNAVERTFVVTKEDGGTNLAYSRLMGAYGASFLSIIWYPPGSRNPGEAILRGSYSLGGQVGGNVFREFWPDIKNRLFGKP
jgi:hypothetical protein